MNLQLVLAPLYATLPLDFLAPLCHRCCHLPDPGPVGDGGIPLDPLDPPVYDDIKELRAVIVLVYFAILFHQLVAEYM